MQIPLGYFQYVSAFLVAATIEGMLIYKSAKNYKCDRQIYTLHSTYHSCIQHCVLVIQISAMKYKQTTYMNRLHLIWSWWLT